MKQGLLGQLAASLALEPVRCCKFSCTRSTRIFTSTHLLLVLVWIPSRCVLSCFVLSVRRVVCGYVSVIQSFVNVLLLWQICYMCVVLLCFDLSVTERRLWKKSFVNILYSLCNLFSPRLVVFVFCFIVVWLVRFVQFFVSREKCRVQPL